MDEEKKPAPGGTGPDAPGDRPPEKKRNMVAFYLIMLFASAFVIVLISFVAQFKSKGELADVREQLNEQLSYSQGVALNIEELQDELQYLKSKLEESKADAAGLENAVYERNDIIFEKEARISDLEEELAALKKESGDAAALNAAYLIYEELTIAHEKGDQASCRSLYKKLTDAPAFFSLPESLRERAAGYAK